MIRLFFEAITTLGDSGFILPAAGALFVALLAAEDRRTALAFAAAVTACAVLTVATKIGFMIYGGFPGRALVHSPSGHASMATIFFSSLGLVAARSKDAGSGRAGAAICAILIALIALSRVALDAHTWAETLIGLGVGLVSFAVFRHFAAARSPIHRRTLAIFVIAVLALYLAFGASVSVEEPLEDIADRIGRMLRR